MQYLDRTQVKVMEIYAAIAQHPYTKVASSKAGEYYTIVSGRAAEFYTIGSRKAIEFYTIGAEAAHKAYVSAAASWASFQKGSEESKEAGKT
jgi:hypothetical protein